MNNGLYTSFMGMRARQRTLDAQANNIANAMTTGYKAERLKYSTIEANEKGESSRQNLVAAAVTSGAADFSAGSINQTGRNLDIAIEGDGFFQIQTPRGPRYTRAGNFTMDSAGQLVTKNGDLVIGARGPITVPKGGELSIGTDGSLSVNGNVFNKLKIVSFENPAAALEKEGNSLFAQTGEEAGKDSVRSIVHQGALESSNINSITEMVSMMNNSREFESMQKSITLIMNDLGRKIAGEIGKM